jgi:SAM-dependent methyltransferase
MAEIPFPEWGAPPRSTETYQDRHHRGEVLDRVSTPHGEFTVLRCQPCVLNHVVPLPEEAWLQRYYAERFYRESHPDYLTRYEADRPWWSWVHTQTLALAEAALGQWRRPLRVLDVGTGPGLFLDVAQARGWETYGIEPNADVAVAASDRGHTVCYRTLREALDDLPIEPALLHLYEVLEHVPDPQEFLLQAAALLEPGGLLHVVVPNDYNVLQLDACARLDLPRWWVAPPEHLTYFSAKTLQLLVRRCGFDILELRGTYPLELFVLSGRNYVGDDALGRQCHQERMALELALDAAGLTDWLFGWYADNVAHPYRGGIGRELVLTARKREG